MNQEKKFRCTAEGCEHYHCRVCGRHYYPEESERSGECPDCTIERASDAAQAQADLFDGNYEEAAKYFGW